MFPKVKAGLVCLFVVLSSSCASQIQHLPVATPQVTPTISTTTPTIVPPSPIPTLQPTPIPPDNINSKNLKQVRLLHQYWLAVATGAGVDPYEMDISAVASSPDGHLIAVGGCSKPLEADLRSGNVSCDGKNPENAGGAPFLLILDANTENVIANIPENTAETTIADLAFTPDGKKLIYAIYPSKFVIWNIASNQIESTLWEGENSTPEIAVSPDGKWIALKTTDQVKVWDVANEKFVAELATFFYPQFSADSKQILVHSAQEFVIYETGTWTELLRFGMPCDCIYTVSPNLSLLATSERAPAETSPITIWDTSTGVQLQSLQPDKGITTFLAFTPDGQMLWRASDRGNLTAWDTSEWNFLGENIGGVTPIFNLRSFQFVGDGRHYLISSDLLLALYGLP
jgi:WD40 repeat protein